ncbi:hypothetical protein BBJ28_00012297 [Nothophytophthora sp. Chile5]|nr:hypothetical protein BBJ28_00012297 [Nothophytophthora sp. Chile5]
MLDLISDTHFAAFPLPVPESTTKMAMKLPLLTVSLATSGALLFAAKHLSDAVGTTSGVRVAFFALLPTLVAVNIVVDRHGWGLFAQVWEALAALGALRHKETFRKLTPAEALAAARAELFHAFSERWPAGLRGRTSLSRLGLSTTRPEVVSSSTSGSSLYEQVKGNLTDHVFTRASADAPVYLMDPVSGCFLKATYQRKLLFTSKASAAGLFHVEKGKTHHWGFHAATTQRYIGQNFVGRVIAGSKKLHAWEAFRVLQRPSDKGSNGCSPQIYLILCSARFGKGMWLANKPGNGHSGINSSSNGSGAVVTSRSSSASFEKEEETSSDHERGNSHSPNRKRGVYLSKQFGHALGLVYGTDLAALVAAAPDVASQTGVSSISHALARAQTAPRLTGALPLVQGTAFQAPVLTRWARGDVRLPWLEAVADANAEATGTPTFLEMPEKDMTEVVTAIVPDCSVQEFLELLVPRATRRKCKMARAALAQSAPIGFAAANGKQSGDATTSGVDGERKGEDNLLREWHLHPQFGLLRALSYRPAAGVLPSATATSNSKSNVKSVAPTSIKSVAIEQYHSCSVDDDLEDEDYVDLQGGSGEKLHKAAIRSKMYTLSIPYSNCFSIETLVDVEDVLVSANDGEASSTAAATLAISSSNGNKQTSASERKSALRVRCCMGVVFSRNTMFRPEIERGALEGVRNSCTMMLEMLRDTNTRRLFMTPQPRRGSVPTSDGPNRASATGSMTALAASGIADSSLDRRVKERTRTAADVAFLPRTFALEVIKGLITNICDAQSLSESLSVLPLQMPWRPFGSSTSSSRPVTRVPSPHAVVATTAMPFFESSPEEFAQVLEENLGGKVTAPLFFEALLSDACSFFRPAHPDSGNMEVDIGAWRSSASPPHRRERIDGFIRKQVFKMPLSGIPGVDVAQVEDFQYYALVKPRSPAPPSSAPGHVSDSGREKKQSFSQSSGSQALSLARDKKRPSSSLGQSREIKTRDTKARRLEFGMKLFVPALPEGSRFSVRLVLLLVVVERMEDGLSNNVLRVLFAAPPRHWHPDTRSHAVVNPHVVAGVLRGLKQIWKQVAHTMVEVCKASSGHGMLLQQQQLQDQAPHGLDDGELDLVQQLQANTKLPTHDELASRLIEAIAAAY